MNTHSPKQIWQDLVDEAGEAEIDRAASVSVAQAERELAAAGFDVAAERARAEAFLDELARPMAPRASDRASGEHARLPAAPVIPISSRTGGAPNPAGRMARRPAAFWLAAAASVAAAGGGMGVWYAQRGAELLVAHPRPTAAELRRDARAACDAQRWNECLSLLDRARDEDPAGDEAPDVQHLRELATKASTGRP